MHKIHTFAYLRLLAFKLRSIKLHDMAQKVHFEFAICSLPALHEEDTSLETSTAVLLVKIQWLA